MSNNPFEGKLPLKWKAVPLIVMGAETLWTISNGDGINIFTAQIDSTIPVEAHIAYAWKRHKKVVGELTWED